MAAGEEAGVGVWHGGYIGSSQRVVQGLLGTPRSFQGICNVTTLFIKVPRYNLPSSLLSAAGFCRAHVRLLL